MTVINTTNKIRQAGDGAQVAFTFPMRTIAASDLKVYVVTNSTGVKVLKTITTHYTVTLNTITEGGTVTMITAPTALEDLLIVRELPFTQPTDIPNRGSVREEQLENEYDRGCMLDQQIDEVLDRAIKLNLTQTGAVDTELPILVASKAITVKSDGLGFEFSTIDANAATQAATSATAALASQNAAATSATNAAASEAAVQTSLTNKSGGVLVEGDVVVVSTTTNASATTTTTQGDLDVIGVVKDASIADNASGLFRVVGRGKVNVLGAFTRGNFLRASTTAKRAEDAGAVPVPGVFAVALESGTSVVADALLFKAIDLNAQLSVDDEGAIESAPGTPTAANPFVPTDQLPISKGAEVNQRICRGMIGAGGSILEGSGFSVVNNGTGDNTITFSPAFSDRPAVAAMIVGEAGVGYVAVADTIAAANIRIRTRHNTTDSPTSVDFLFIAFGPA